MTIFLLRVHQLTQIRALSDNNQHKDTKYRYDTIVERYNRLGYDRLRVQYSSNFQSIVINTQANAKTQFNRIDTQAINFDQL